MRRIEQEELLDAGQVSPAEVERNLQDLRTINRYLGGSAMHAGLLRRVAGACFVLPGFSQGGRSGVFLGENAQSSDASALHPQGTCSSRSGSKSLHILEVAAGRGDVLHMACTQLRQAGVETHITLLDRRACHLPRPGDWNALLPPPERLTGDALRLPLADRSVDIVSCCLFLHHLNVREVAQFLAEALRVARVAVVLNDLERSRRHWLLALAGRLFYRSSLSRHDGPVSVRRAYTHAELCALLQATEQPFETYRGFLFRIGAIVWQTESAPSISTARATKTQAKSTESISPEGVL